MDLGGLPKSSESQECSKNDLITLDFLKEHLEYRDGHLWWIKPTARCVKIGQQFGTAFWQLYDLATTKRLVKETKVPVGTPVTKDDLSANQIKPYATPNKVM